MNSPITSSSVWWIISLVSLFLWPIKSLLPHEGGLLCLSPASSRVHPRLIFSTVLLTIYFTIQDCFHPSLNYLSAIPIMMAAVCFFSSLFLAFYLSLKTPRWPLNPPVPPGIRPVTHLYLSEVTSDSVSVAWNAPAPPADLFILSYSSADGTDTSKVTLDGSKTRSLVQGLLPSTYYTISLITIQGDVTSEPITASLTTGEQLNLMKKVLPKVTQVWQKWGLMNIYSKGLWCCVNNNAVILESCHSFSACPVCIGFLYVNLTWDHV